MRPSARPLWAGKRRVTTPSSALRRGNSCPCQPQTEAQKALWDSLTFVEDPASGRWRKICSRTGLPGGMIFTRSSAPSAAGARHWSDLEQGGNIVCTVGAYALCNGQALPACRQTAEALRGQRVGGRSSSRWPTPSPHRGISPFSSAAPSGCIFTHNSASTRLAPLRVTKARLERIKNFKHVNAEPFL